MNDTPAFPVNAMTTNKGMTLRDYFAAEAMQNMDWKIKPYNNLRPNAEVAYAIADAMMKVREA